MRSWEDSDMAAAVDKVKDGMSVRKAADKYNVPRSTLSDRVTGRIELGSKWGKQSKLSYRDEEEILRASTDRADKGIGFSNQNFLRYAGIFAREKCVPFKKATPSEMWWRSLKARHPKFTLQTPEATATNRHDAMTRERIKLYFDSLNDVFEQHDLQRYPCRIWNMDETGINATHKPLKVLANKGSKTVHGKASISKETITVIACGNAAGDKVPPHFIIPGKTSKKLHGFDTESCRDPCSPLNGANFSVSESGWTRAGIGQLWFEKTFLANIGEARPQLLVCDGHGSHNNIEFIRLAREANIIIVELPSHTSHWTQPFDRSVFKSLKSSWNRHVDDFVKETGISLGHSSFLRVFAKAWKDSLTQSNIRSGFKATGLYPFDRAAIPDVAFKPSDATHTDGQTPAAGNTASEHTDGIESHFIEGAHENHDAQLNMDPTLPCLDISSESDLNLSIDHDNVSAITFTLPLIETQDFLSTEYDIVLQPEADPEEATMVTDQKALEVVESALEPQTLSRYCAAFLSGADFANDKLFQTWKLYKTKTLKACPSISAQSILQTAFPLPKKTQQNENRRRKINDGYFVITADDVYQEKVDRENEKKLKREQMEQRKIERENKKTLNVSNKQKKEQRKIEREKNKTLNVSKKVKSK